MVKMKYIIMCGGNYKHWEKPRQLSIVDNEEIVARTIRLLRENGVKDIAISSNNPIFEKFGVPVLKHDNLYVAQGFEIEEGYWFNCFYPTNEPTCYIFGDVVFSPQAIKTIVETETDDIEFFGSKEPYAKEYIKEHQEPFALKVVNTNHLWEAIKTTKKLDKMGVFKRKPIMWELWAVIKGTIFEENSKLVNDNYVVIRDYTCDVDWQEDVYKIRTHLEKPTKELMIVIAYYKTYELTCKLLDVLIPQLNDKVDVYLIDDGCHEKRLDKYSKDINIIHLDKNTGGASATNVGLMKMTGKYVALIDSDDLISNDYISSLLDIIKTRKEDVIFFDWQDMNTKEIVRRPHNYAPWKAIYKREIMPLFIEGWIYSYDVPFQEELSRIEHTEYFIDKVLYYYNSNREGSLTIEKEKIRRMKMIKCEVIEKFNIANFGALKNIKRAGVDKEGTLFIGDTFECDEEMAKYLTGENVFKRAFVRIIEVTPEKVKDAIFEEVEEPKKKTTKKSTKSKK